MYQRLLNEWLKTEEGATLFNKHKRDIDLLSGFASWLESRPTPRAADEAICTCTHDVYENPSKPGHCHGCGKPLRR
jgi:hypothetical protein